MAFFQDATGSTNDPLTGQSLTCDLGLTQASNLRMVFKILTAKSLEARAGLAQGLTYS
jgi:hypothetical protein